jgi:hypothetical protein
MIPLTIKLDTTRAELVAEYQRCSGYDVDNDAAAARQFVRVCRALLSPRFPQEATSGSKAATSTAIIAVEQLERQLTAALKWLQINDPTFRSSQAGGGVVYGTVDSDWRGA